MTTGPTLDQTLPRPDLPVIDRLGVTLRAAGPGADPAVLLGLALRDNPRRAQLLVSRVLGKHVPTDPRLVRTGGLLLGMLVSDALAGRPPRQLPVELLHAAVRDEPGAARDLQELALRELVTGGSHDGALVLGFAETATALGHTVAEGLALAGGDTDYLHSTRRPVEGYATAGGFTEEHSHATEHLLLPADADLFRGGRPLVLVDDELSTGRTALNTIVALHRIAPRAHYVVAALVDVQPDEGATGILAAGVAALGARLDVVSLSRAAVDLPPDVLDRAAVLRAGLPLSALPRHLPSADAVVHNPQLACPEVPTRVSAGPDSRVELVAHGWPDGVPVGGRHGFGTADHRTLEQALPELAAALGVQSGERTLVLGTEELMALPLRLAQTLADRGRDVRFSTTTRSPAVVVDEPGYALRSGITFPAHDAPADGPGPRFAYNVGTAGDPLWDHVVVVVDPPADTPALQAGLLAALAPRTRRTTLVITP